MTGHARIGVQLWPGGTPDYRSWRDAVLRSEDMGVDVMFGYDNFHKPFVQLTSEAPLCCRSSQLPKATLISFSLAVQLTPDTS